MSPIIIKTVNRLLLQALEEEAGSIHCEFIRGVGLEVSFGSSGNLKPVAAFTEPLATDIKNYLHTLLKWPLDKIPGLARIAVTTTAGRLILEAKGLSTKNEKKIILNLKPAKQELLALDSLGLNNEHLNLLKPAITTNGLVIITGPNGSGKTTTAYAILTALNASRANVYAVENFISQDLPGINQLSRPSGLSWPMLFRTLAKQDADIIYLDLNDSLPSPADLNALVMRRLVIVNLEADSINECLAKLNLGQGVDKINLFIHQNLARRLCPHCAFAYKLDQATFDELVKDFGVLDEDLIGLNLYHSAGCEACHHSGHLGHLGLFAMLAPSPELKKLLADLNTSKQTSAQIDEELTLSLPEDGFIKAIQGLITVEELKKLLAFSR